MDSKAKIEDRQDPIEHAGSLEVEETEKRRNEGFEDLTNTVPEEQRKQLLRKMDFRLLPLLMVLYLLAFIDRANIGNAKIEGLEDDLGLSPKEYQITLSVFFISYILFEVPSNYVLEKYFAKRPATWIGILAVGWGVSMTMHGVVQNFEGIAMVRFIMGIFEAGFFPGALAIMNQWYTKYELGKRIAIFYTASALSGAFSGLLAFAIAKMDGIGGLEGWRWIFLLEGIATVLFGGICWALLPSNPVQRPSWLAEEEIEYLINRMVAQNGGVEADKAGKEVSWGTFWAVVTDIQYYGFVFLCLSNTVPNYGFKFMLPQIIKDMGYTASNAQLLSIPPYVAGAISSITFNFLGDKFQRRSWFLIGPISCIIVAYCILIPLSPNTQDNIGPSFFAVILANIGCYPIAPGVSAWASNNSAGAAKRSVALAYILSYSSIGGIIASYIFIESESPGYPTGFGVSVAFATGGIIAATCLDLYYTRQNKKHDGMTMVEISAKYSQEELAGMGNKSPLFRYTL